MLYLTNFAQAPGTITTVESVFGGRINAISGGNVGKTVLSDTFRIFVATESANSIFYTYGHFPKLGTSTVDSFIALPSANANAGLGSNISKMAFHKTSQTLYFIASGNIYSTTVTDPSATKLTSSNIYADLIVEGNNFYSLTKNGSDNTVYYSTIDATNGALTAVGNTTVSAQSYTSLVNGKDDKLYLFRSSTDPQALQFGGTFSAGINLGATTIDTMASLVATITWNCMGVYTDGTVFVGGTNGGTNPYKYVANGATFNPATYTTVATGISGTSGSNIEFREDGFFSNYYVYFGRAYSTSKGAASTWNIFGNAGLETHPNDGAVKFFNNHIANYGTLLLTTDAGLGITKNSGSVISDINDGILATQVEDFDMNSSKTFGWLAAKDGIRYVNNYNTTAKAWTNAFWPSGDGSPYYSAEMVANDTNSVYVGNVRIYKTTDKGTTWNKMFTPENAPYSFPGVGVRAEAIAVSDSLNNIVMAGYYNQNAGQYGGVFYSMDGGTNWNQLLINATVVGQDVNVNDIEMTTDSGKVVAYIGVEYINSNIRGMYKAQYDGTSWTVRREEIYSASTALFSVKDIVIHSKDTILAVGEFYHSGLGQKYGMHFSISRPTRNIWNNAINTTHHGGYTACAWNNDTLFYAFQDSILYDKLTFDATGAHLVGIALYSTVDRGTEINVMYYDELLVGSSTGFRSMRGATKVYEAPPAATVTIATITTNICNGNAVTINAIGSNAGNAPVYQWKRNNNSLGAGNTITIPAGSLATGDTISCTLIVNSEVKVNSNKLVFIVNQSPVISKIYNARTGQIISATTICNLNDTLILANNTFNGGWNSSNNAIANISIVPNLNNRFSLVKPTNSGTVTISYNVVATNGCMAKENVVVTVAPLNAPMPIVGPNNLCVGTSAALSSSTANGVWSSLNNRATINAASGVIMGVNAGSASIIYTVSSSSGCKAFATKTVVINSLPSIPTIGYAPGTMNPQIGAGGGFCNNKSFTLAGLPTGGNWSSSNNMVLKVNTVGLANTIGLGNASLTYTITLNGCSNSKTITGVVVNCAARGVNGVSSEQLAASNEFTMYPNPAKSFISLSVNTLMGAGSIVVTDLYGKTLKTQALSMGTNTVNVSNLSKGMYFVSTITNEGKTAKKLVVE